MTKEQRDWANHVIAGKKPSEACLLVWPTISKKTASNRGGKLGKDREIGEYIKEQSLKIGQKVTEKVTEGLSDIESNLILTSAKKREILAKIASGDFEVEKLVQVSDDDGKKTWKKIKVKPDINDIMKAIDLDNKMSGDHVQAKPNQVAKAEEVTKVIIIEDTTKPTK